MSWIKGLKIAVSETEPYIKHQNYYPVAISMATAWHPGIWKVWKLQPWDVFFSLSAEPYFFELP